jgi:hypothetical protein
MAFHKSGSLDPHGAPVLRREIIANSITVVVNDSVKFASGFVALGTAGALVLGHVVGIGTNQGVGLNTTGVAGAPIGSYAGSYLTASNNQTVGKVRADIDVSKQTLYSAELDAAAGTTTGSNLAGYNMDLTDEDTLDESTAVTTTAQYNSFGLDPQDSARVIVHILESQVYGV